MQNVSSARVSSLWGKVAPFSISGSSVDSIYTGLDRSLSTPIEEGGMYISAYKMNSLMFFATFGFFYFNKDLTFRYDNRIVAKNGGYNIEAILDKVPYARFVYCRYQSQRNSNNVVPSDDGDARWRKLDSFEPLSSVSGSIMNKVLGICPGGASV